MSIFNRFNSFSTSSRRPDISSSFRLYCLDGNTVSPTNPTICKHHRQSLTAFQKTENLHLLLLLNYIYAKMLKGVQQGLQLILIN